MGASKQNRLENTALGNDTVVSFEVKMIKKFLSKYGLSLYFVINEIDCFILDFYGKQRKPTVPCYSVNLYNRTGYKE
jgi:hypothetical protein